MIEIHNRIKIGTLAKLFDTTRQTISRWRGEKKATPALTFAYKYLDEEKINEFIETGKVEYFEGMDKREVLNPNIENLILKDINKEFYINQKNLWIKEIFKTFAIQTQYKPLNHEMRDFLNNIDEEKEYFYESFTSFLHKHRGKFYSKDRIEAEMLMCKIFTKNEIYMYYYFKHISNFEKRYN